MNNIELKVLNEEEFRKCELWLFSLEVPLSSITAAIHCLYNNRIYYYRAQYVAETGKFLLVTEGMEYNAY